MTAPIDSHVGPSTVMPRAGLALALMLSINLFNYIDRQVLSAVLPKLEMDANLFRPDDPLLKTKLGLLTMAFLVSYMIIAPVFGRLGDRVSRWKLIAAGVICWSLASGGSGLATTFGILLLTRCFVGIGEGAYGPIAPTMLADMYPVGSRGKIMSLFYLAIPVGSALGFVIGGLVAEKYGWPMAFKVVVLPGLILGGLCFFMPEPRRIGDHHTKKSIPWKTVIKELRGIRSYVLCTLGMTCTTFVLGGVAAWAPYYIFEREARFHISPAKVAHLAEQKTTDGVPIVPAAIITKLERLTGDTIYSMAELKDKLKDSELTPEERTQYNSRLVDALTADESIKLDTIDFRFGVIIVVSGLLATIFGGWLGDRLRTRVRGAYFQVSGVSALLGFPAFLMMIFMPFPYAWIGVFLAVFLLFVNTGPANAILANVVRPEIRATGFAINILVIHGFGDAIAAPIIGGIADLSDLSTALTAISFLILLGGILWIMGARSLDAETEAVSRNEQ